MSVENKTYLNIGSGKSISIANVAEAIQSICKRLYDIDVTIQRNNLNTSPTLVDNELNIAKARSLGLLLNTASIIDGLEAYIKWRRNENIL